MRSVIQHQCRLTLRLREQARSHRLYFVRYLFHRGLDHRQLRVVEPDFGQHPVMLHVTAAHAQAVVERSADQATFRFEVGKTG
ncbi:hypothetical protein D3C76_1225230 [compost metagenome]